MQMTAFKDPRYCDDTVLQNVNEFVTLSKNIQKTNTEHLNNVMNHILPIMKEQDETFNQMYNSITYGGSFYKGIKVGEPDEYDLDLIIKLQETPLQVEMAKNKPGYVKMKRRDHRVDIWENYHGSAFDNFINEEGYLDQNKFRSWMETVSSKMVKKLPTNTDAKYFISAHKSGPAQTLIVEIPSENQEINIDMVGCLKFSLIKPPQGFSCSSGSWLAIPKPLPGVYEGNLLWRACFYDQEKELLRSKKHLKNVLRLLKKLRDTQNFKSLSSYYIESLFFHEIKSQDANFWENNPLTFLFMHMLRKLQKATKKHRIPFYWSTQMNLLSSISKNAMKNIANRVKDIVDEIDSMIDSDRFVIARFILNEKEMRELKTEYY